MGARSFTNLPVLKTRNSRFIGGPTRIVYERVVEGEVSDNDFPVMVEEIRRVMQNVGQVRGGGIGPLVAGLVNGLGMHPAGFLLMIPLWLTTVFATARTTYHYSAKSRARTLEELADRLTVLAHDLVGEHNLPPRAESRRLIS